MALEVYPFFVWTIRSQLAGPRFSQSSLCDVIVSVDQNFKGSPDKGGGLKFVPSYSEIRSFMKDSFRVLLELRGSLVRIIRSSSVWVFRFKRGERQMLSSRYDALSGEGVLSAQGFVRVRILENSVFLLRLGCGSHKGVEQGGVDIHPSLLGTGRDTRA